MFRKLKWQILVARYNWCQGPVPGRGPAIEKHCSTQSPTSAALRQQEKRARLFPSWGLQRGKNQRGQYLDRVVWGRAVGLSFVIAYCMFKLACGRALCWRGIAQHFVRSGCRETRLLGFESLSVQIWVNGLTTGHTVYRNNPLCIPLPQKGRWGHDFRCWRDSLNFVFYNSKL
jgi:hypothetical protein